MRADRRSTSPRILSQTVWLMGIGQQLRAEYTAIEPPEPLPEHLAVLLQQLEAGEKYPQPGVSGWGILDVQARVSSCQNRRGPRQLPCRYPIWNRLVLASLAYVRDGRRSAGSKNSFWTCLIIISKDLNVCQPSKNLSLT